MVTLETKQMLAAAVDACDSKKAEDIRILALDPAESSLTDYLLICSGSSDRQNVAIADEIDIRLKREFGTLPNSVEGRRQGEWVVMDYVDFIVHIFLPEKRDFYGLERLRKSATTIHPDELNAEVASKMKKMREKTPAKTAPAKKAVVKKAVVKKAAPVKKAASAKKAVAKKTVKKAAPAKKAVAVKKAPAKKSAAKKSTKKK
jgi:ribosome-associated protein